MLAYLFIIAAFTFWIHAERKLSLSKRIGGAIVFWGSCLFSVHFGHSVVTNYERTYVARALRSVASDVSSERRDEYLKLAEAYEKRTLNGAKLMLESEKVRQLNLKEAEQVGTGQPATRPESESEGDDKPQPEAEGRSR